VGRESEYRTLYDAWQGLRQGSNAHILLTGESGVGKTRLVERLTTAAGLDGAAVSRVQSYELEQEIPYATVSGLILGLLALPEVSGTPPEALAELSRTVPDVRRRFPAIPPARDTQGDTARIELAEAFHQLLQAITEERPIILVVDDVHLADDASLSVLHLVARRARGERLMMIFIARLGGGAPPQSLERLMHGASATGIQPLELRGLSRDESVELLTCLADADGIALPAGVRSTLLRAGRGVPMVLEFLLQDWRTNGDASLALAVSAMTSELAGGCKGPETYRHILSGLVRALDTPARTVLDFAAILGPRLNDLSMYALADLSLGQTLSGLVQLASLHVLRETGHGFEFANELLRAEVYASVPSPLRRTLHGSIADRLLALEPTMDVSGLEIAWHCVRAGRREEALPHLLSGARQAMRRGAAHLAQRALETAMPGLTEPESIEASLILVEALQEQGHWRESLDLVREVPVLSGETGMYAEALEATALRRLGTHFATAVHQRVPRLLSLVLESSSPRTKVKAAQVLAYLAVEVRDQSLATNLLGALHEALEGNSDEDIASNYALTRAMLLRLIGETAASEELVKDTIENLRRNGTGNLLTVQLPGILGTLYTLEGKYAEAIENFLHGHELARRAGVDTLVAAMAGNLSLSYCRLGDYDRQFEWANRAPDPWGAEFGGFVEVQLAYYKGVAQAMTGRSEVIAEIITGLEARMECALPEWIQQAWQLWKADLVMLTGRKSDALAIAKGAVTRFGSAPLVTSFVGAFDRWLAVCATTMSEIAAASRLINDHMDRLTDFDALDQIEILCGGTRLARSGLERLEIERALQDRVSRAAPGVPILLRRLEFLPN
jgi:tetratricopeptide (TPR) repeat protein